MIEKIIKFQKNIKFLLYLDILINIIILLLIIISLIPNSFSIIPIKFTRPFIGINDLINIFNTLHYILIGISISFIIQSIIILNEYKLNKIESSTIKKLLFYRWFILTLNSIVPITLNIKIPPIFIMMPILILTYAWYSLLD